MDTQDQYNKNHEHNGSDSQKVKGRNIANAPQPAITAANATALSSGGAAVLSTSDSTVITNMRTRINALEDALQALGLLH